MSFDEVSNLDYCLLSGALIELTYFTDTLMNLGNGDKHDHAEPTTATHGSQTCSGCTPTVHQRQTSQQLKHPAKLPQTGGYNSAIPRLKSLHSGHIRGTFKKKSPETKRLYPNMGGFVSSKARIIVTPSGRQQTSGEDIGRRCGCKQNMSARIIVTPRGRQQISEEDIGRRCGRKQNVSTRIIVTPRGRQQTSEEDIGRGCGCKQNVSARIIVTPRGRQQTSEEDIGRRCGCKQMITFGKP